MIIVVSNSNNSKGRLLCDKNDLLCFDFFEFSFLHHCHLSPSLSSFFSFASYYCDDYFNSFIDAYVVLSFSSDSFYSSNVLLFLVASCTCSYES